jgi:hypothetical protein
MKLSKHTKVNLCIAISIAMFLGFIDEGYCNFNWMKNIGNWIALSIYALFIFGILSAITFGYKKLKSQMKNSKTSTS